MPNNYVATVRQQVTVLRRTGHPDLPYGSTPQVPTAPTALPVIDITSDGGTFPWSETTDPLVVAHAVYLNGNKLPVALGGAARQHILTGLLPNTPYTLRVTRSWAGNVESPVSNQISFTTAGVTPPVEINTLMGVPDNGNNHGYTNWDAWRIYNISQVDGAVSKGAKVVCLTDSGLSYAPSSAGTRSANAQALRDFLMSFYGKTGAPNLHTNVEIHWANGNELDINLSPTAANLTNFAEMCKAYEDVIADFNLASLWFDGTALSSRNGDTDQFLDAQTGAGRRVHQMLTASGGGHASSYYAPGRNDYPNMAPSSYTGNSDPSFVVDPILELAVARNIPRVAIWEFGMPMLITPPPLFPNPGSVQNNPTRRRTYVQDYINYWFQACLDNNLNPKVALYWDQQSGANKGTPQNGGAEGPNPDNRWVNDNTLITPNTATIWREAPASFVPA